MSMKPIEFTTHGLHRLAERGLFPSEAREMIRNGYKLTPTKKDNKGVVRPYEYQNWRFIVHETPNDITVITAWEERKTT